MGVNGGLVRADRGDKVPAMRAAILKAFGDPATSLIVGEMETPVPRPGQVLVKVEAATVNPADGAFVLGYYAQRSRCRRCPGSRGRAR